jgi:hypothetical protein
MVCEYNSNVLTALPWLLTWSELEEDFSEDGDGNDDVGAN